MATFKKRKGKALNCTHKHGVDPRLEAAYARGRIARKKLLAAEGGTISVGEAARCLGISRAMLLRRYRNGQVLGWKEAGKSDVWFPIWQFKGGKVLPGLLETISALKDGAQLDDIGLILFFLSEFAFLEQRRPLDLLREGRLSDALRAATAYTC